MVQTYGTAVTVPVTHNIYNFDSIIACCNLISIILLARTHLETSDRLSNPSRILIKQRNLDIPSKEDDHNIINLMANCKSRRPLVKEIGCTSCSCPTLSSLHSERKRKQVTFSPHVRAKGILHVDDYTDEELVSTWYGPEDMEQIKKDIRQTLAKMESGELEQDEDKHFCRRGLESRTKDGASMKKHIRRTARNAVLDGQDWHGMDNEQLISEEYMDLTLVSKLDAARRGFDDLQEVIDHQRSHLISIGSPQHPRKMSYCLQNESLRQWYNHAAA